MMMCISEPWLTEKLGERVRGSVHVSLYVRPLDEARPFIYDERVMPSASLIKVPIMAEAFRQEKEGRIRFEDMLLVYDPVEGGSFYGGPPDSKVSLYDLIFHMIVESDNTCANMLMDILGADRINEGFLRWGMDHTILRRKMMDFAAARAGRENMTTVSDMGRFFTLLADGRCVDEERSQAMLAILSQQEDNAILPAQIPHSVRVDHKTGELEGIYHDCGIVYSPRRVYICCMMADGITDEPRTVYDLSYLARDIYDRL